RGADMPNEKRKMLAGELYDPGDPELVADRARAARWMARYNAMLAEGPQARLAVLRQGLGGVGERVEVRPPFHCDYGYNIRIADGAFVNFGCVILDVVEVTVGQGAQIGPNVQILAADHPRETKVRAAGLEFGRPVRIGRNAWVGGGAVLLPGVTVGDDAIVGAGAVVTRDVPAGVTAVGNPARMR